MSWVLVEKKTCPLRNKQFMLFQQSTGVHWGKEVHVLVEKQTPLGKKQFMSWQKGRRHQEKSSSCPSRKEVESNEKKAVHFLAEKYTCPFWKSGSCPGRNVDGSIGKKAVHVLAEKQTCPIRKAVHVLVAKQTFPMIKYSSCPGIKAVHILVEKQAGTL